MKRDFAALDPRTRLLSVLCAIALISSTPVEPRIPYLLYCVFIATFWALSGLSGRKVIRRLLSAFPIVALAAVSLLVGERASPESIAAACAVVMKGGLAATLAALLTVSTGLPELIWALRKLGVPASFCEILALMYRYVDVLTGEFQRMDRARQSRGVLSLRELPIAVIGGQFATLLIRSSHRAERVYAAMQARGFSGVWPIPRPPNFRAADATFFATMLILLGAARFVAI